MREKDIVHENGNHWVYRKDHGWYEVYKAGITHSVRVATYHFRNDPDGALKRAIFDCELRAKLSCSPS